MNDELLTVGAAFRGYRILRRIGIGKNPVLLLGATNVPWMIDEGDIPHEPGLTAHIAERTEGYSGADLRGVMARLRQMAFDRRSQLYTCGLADEVLSASSPTTSEETVRRIREWERTSG